MPCGIKVKNIFDASQEEPTAPGTTLMKVSNEYQAPSLLDMAALDPMAHTIMINNKPHIIIANDRNIIINNSQIRMKKELKKGSVCYYKKGNNEVKEGLKRLVKDERKRQKKPYGLVQELYQQRSTNRQLQLEINDMQEYLLEERQQFKADMKMLQTELKNVKECRRAERRKFETDKKLYGELLTERDRFIDEVDELEDDLEELRQRKKRIDVQTQYLVGLILGLVYFCLFVISHPVKIAVLWHYFVEAQL